MIPRYAMKKDKLHSFHVLNEKTHCTSQPIQEKMYFTNLADKEVQHISLTFIGDNDTNSILCYDKLLRTRWFVLKVFVMQCHNQFHFSE